MKETIETLKELRAELDLLYTNCKSENTTEATFMALAYKNASLKTSEKIHALLNNQVKNLA